MVAAPTTLGFDMLHIGDRRRARSARHCRASTATRVHGVQTLNDAADLLERRGARVRRPRRRGRRRLHRAGDGRGVRRARVPVGHGDRGRPGGHANARSPTWARWSPTRCAKKGVVVELDRRVDRLRTPARSTPTTATWPPTSSSSASASRPTATLAAAAGLATGVHGRNRGRSAPAHVGGRRVGRGRLLRVVPPGRRSARCTSRWAPSPTSRRAWPASTSAAATPRSLVWSAPRSPRSARPRSAAPASASARPTAYGFAAMAATIESSTRAGYFPGASVDHGQVGGRARRPAGCSAARSSGSRARPSASTSSPPRSPRGMTVEEIVALDLSYAPPFGPVWDPGAGRGAEGRRRARVAPTLS